jgi:hypothetical protein
MDHDTRFGWRFLLVNGIYLIGRENELKGRRKKKRREEKRRTKAKGSRRSSLRKEKYLIIWQSQSQSQPT